LIELSGGEIYFGTNVFNLFVVVVPLFQQPECFCDDCGGVRIISQSCNPANSSETTAGQPLLKITTLSLKKMGSVHLEALTWWWEFDIAQRPATTATLNHL
jgi:hypothetical protein